MEPRSLHLLEFSKVLSFLGDLTVSEAGKRECLSLAPLPRLEDVLQKSSLLKQAIVWEAESGFSLSSFVDIAGLFDFIQQNKTQALDVDGLWGLKQCLQVGRSARELICEVSEERFGLLQQLAMDCPWPQKVWAGLKRCIADDALIRDESSPELFSVRQEIRRINSLCTRKVTDFFQDRDQLHFLQDDMLTISSDRYVVALKSNFKTRIQGIVHDYSQTGETCYFEPLFLVELNNELQALKQEEAAEELKILKYLTGLVRDEALALQNFYSWLVSMDVLLAKVELNSRLQGSLLTVQNQGQLNLLQARHPLLVLKAQDAVPVDICLEAEQQVLVVSGGNSGGKTVCLKTWGVIALMALSGLSVPVAEGSCIPWWDKVVVSMGDEQSLEDSLSTFTAQINHFSRVWPDVDSQTLVILDEFGVGTDPSQGAALAQAVVDGLLERGAWVGVATHFPALKAYALSRSRVRAASVVFDPHTKKPLFKLAYDQVGASQALEVAKEQGLPDEILSKAREYLYLDGSDNQSLFERLNSLAYEREKALQSLEQEKLQQQKQFNKKQLKLEQEKEKVFKELRQQSQQILKQWQEDKIGRKQALKKMAQLREQTRPQKSEPKASNLSWEQVEPGMSLFYPAWKKVGLVSEKDERKQKLRLDLGGVSIWVGLDDIQLPPQEANKNMAAVRTRVEKNQSFRLDLRGQRADEALSELEKFVDRALLSGCSELEIIHGKGTGALKAAVQDYLRGCPAVSSFDFGNADEGGEGMTKVLLH